MHQTTWYLVLCIANLSFFGRYAWFGIRSVVKWQWKRSVCKSNIWWSSCSWWRFSSRYEIHKFLSLVLFCRLKGNCRLDLYYIFSLAVIFKGSNLKLQTTVTVLKADQILVDSPAETLTNVPSPPEGYWFPVKIRCVW